jgi:hypothetical protein
MKQCEVCKIDISGKKGTARTCSPKCRKDLSRLESVTPNVTLSDPIVTLEFEFYTRTVDRVSQLGKVPGEKNPIKKARYWYEVPIAAVPVIKKGWPKMPDYMNGRQYFLWWKNEFKETNNGPEILNPNK